MCLCVSKINDIIMQFEYFFTPWRLCGKKLVKSKNI